jgi:hypothetical protein
VSAPPFRLVVTPDARKVIDSLRAPTYRTKEKKVAKALRLLQDAGPSHPGLNSHRYESITGPAGEEVWESYVENRTPSAWRIWWSYGPEPGHITIVMIGPHP